METLNFIIGGLYTLIVLSVGAILGHLMTSKKIDDKVREVKNRLTPPPPTSGSIKAITPEEIRNESKKGFIRKMEDLIS